MKSDDIVFNVIYPACQYLDMFSLDAVAIMTGACAQETNMFNTIFQTTFEYGSDINKFNGGIGGWQEEKIDFDDINKNFIDNRVDLKAKILKWAGVIDYSRIATDMILAAMYCRLHFARAPGALPDWHDISGMAAYYKKYYNSGVGAATEWQFINNYHLYAEKSVLKFANFIANKK